MTSEFNSNIKLSVFGESHSEYIGCKIEGIPAGENIDFDFILKQMARRAPGNDKTATPRKEKDFPEVLSGIINGVTDGNAIEMRIYNTNTRSGDYLGINVTPRPSHADFPATVKYGDKFDYRGGGHFSGRLTAPIVFAGAVAKQILARKGIIIGAHIASIGAANDDCFDKVNVSKELLEELQTSRFAIINKERETVLRNEVEKARLDCNSIGGTIECAVTGVPTGFGDTMFTSLESRISSMIFAVPAVKGIEFGRGFALSQMYGSEANDPYRIVNGEIKTVTNNNGGILGGLATGMPIVFKVAVKPTPSIGKEQKTVNLKTMTNDTISVHGRHDPCIVPRAVPVIESACALALLDAFLEE